MKKFLSFLIVLFATFFCLNSVFADEYKSYDYTFASDFTEGNNQQQSIIRCEYFNAEKAKSYIVDFFYKRIEGYGYKFWVDLTDGNTLVDANARDESVKVPGAISYFYLQDYILSTQDCPLYAAPYGNSYIFYNENNQEVEYSLELFKKKYNKDFCFYEFPNPSNEKWSMIIHKSPESFQGFKNEYTGAACPKYIGMELRMFLSGTFSEMGKAYDIVVAGDTIDVGRDCSLKYVPEFIDANPIYNFETSEFNCYVGNLTEKIDLNKDISIIDPNGEINYEGFFDDDVKKFISDAYFYIEIIAFVLVIAFSIRDYMNVIINSNQDEMKKSNSKLVKRIAILVIIILLPSLVRLLFRTFKVDIFGTNDPLGNNLRRENK